MMRNALRGAREIEEAAAWTAPTTSHMLLKVMLPLVWPGIVTIALFASSAPGMSSWQLSC